MSPLTRRSLLQSIPALAAASGVAGPFMSRLSAQAKTQMPVHTLSHATLTVTDPVRSLKFYQGLFGMPIQAKQGAAPSLQIGSGPEFLFLAGGGANAKPGINHFCVTMAGFSVDKVAKILAEHGIAKADAAGGMAGGPLKYRVRIRPENLGGAKDGTPEFYIGDPDGLVVQLQDDTYCGGAGALGEVCSVPPEASPAKGLIKVEDLSHFTLFASDAAKSQAFYQDLFAMPISGHQGAMPLLGVGSKAQFLAIGPGGTRPPEINHLCMRMKNFKPDEVMKTLADFGISKREGTSGPVPPMKSYITMRMPNRGGAKDGTPELYFTDPDGILIQLQDVSYCGGGGSQGEICVAG
jgi:catechol 2,3-dioxygenase-like lactoylglutathione lyase family enzyme